VTWLLAAALAWILFCLILIERDRRRRPSQLSSFSGPESPRRSFGRRVARESLSHREDPPRGAASRASGPGIYDRMMEPSE
jgi:hypothetical protein